MISMFCVAEEPVSEEAGDAASRKVHPFSVD